MMLTTEERTRFAAYLRACAIDDDHMANQLDKMGPMHMVMAKRYHTEAMAALIIANKLEATHTEKP